MTKTRSMMYRGKRLIITPGEKLDKERGLVMRCIDHVVDGGMLDGHDGAVCSLGYLVHVPNGDGSREDGQGHATELSLYFRLDARHGRLDPRILDGFNVRFQSGPGACKGDRLACSCHGTLDPGISGKEGARG